MSHTYASNWNVYQQNTEHNENMKYKKKYRKLKRIVKDLVFENAALCDQVSSMQENLLVVKDERLYLLRKLCQIQGENESAVPRSQLNINNHATSQNFGVDAMGKKSNKKKMANDGSIIAGGIAEANKKFTINNDSKPKAKRYAKTMKKMVQLIPLDAHGRPLFPISLGDLTIYSLGEVVTDRISYHTEDLIYPVGFCSTRVYASLKDPRAKSLYTCKILDGGVKPRFEIVSDTELDQPLVGMNPDECHVKLLSSISPMLCNIPPKGAHFFGIAHPTIQNLIQSSPGTRKLALYKPQRFEVSKNQSNEGGINPLTEDEADPGINFTVLHKTFAFTSNYGIKEEPCDHDF